MTLAWSSGEISLGYSAELFLATKKLLTHLLIQ